MNARLRLLYFLAIVTLATTLVASRPTRAAEDLAAKRARLEAEAASSDSKKAALALYELGKMDDDDFRFASALARFDASLVRDPSHRYALRARSRGDTLRAHSEGDFAPFAELEKIRRDHVAARDPAALDKLVADANDFPPGLVRVESRMLAGDAFLARREFDKALPILELVITDPKADPISFHQASHEVVDTYLALENPDAAARIAALPHEDPTLAKKVKIWRRRKNGRELAGVVLAAFAIACFVAIARAIRRGELDALKTTLKKFAPLAVLFAIWIGACGGILASSYETGNEGPFVVLAIVALPIFFLARAWSASSANASLLFRVGRGLLTAGAMLAAAFVVLASMRDGIYLGGFGL